MAALEAALGQAIAGNAQVVGVVAEPGTGKSRLCFEFVERCRARGVTVYEAHGLSHTKLVPFHPILELLRAVFRITEQDGNEAAREKIAGRMLLLDETLAEGCRSCSISSACLIQIGPLRRSVPRRGSGSFST
jgi:predicted ATPase